ncbi:MAG: hypothetical protein VYA80_02085 [Pseudomonadota bacterium]|nr:hypothetical protein [Pseudomonadota bacterium]
MGLKLIGVDDANILFVYSKHLAAGEGLVYNIGEEHVEGFSSVSWMLLTTLGYLISNNPKIIFFAINIFLVGLALAYGWKTIQSISENSSTFNTSLLNLPGFIWIIWIITNPSYFIWTTTSLMETGLWSSLLLSATFLLLNFINEHHVNRRQLKIFNLIILILLLTRPEGMAWSLYFLTALLIILRQKDIGLLDIGRYWIPVAASSLICVASLIIFRLNYFGFPLPNTYYAKMTSDPIFEIQWGLIYLQNFLIHNKIAGILIFFALIIFLRYVISVLKLITSGKKTLTPIQFSRFFLSSTILVGMLLPVLMGGDIFGGFRFFQPIWPLIILPLLFWPAPKMLIESKSKVFIICIVTLFAFTFAQTIRWPSLSLDRGRIAHLYELTHRGILTGQYIQEIFNDSQNIQLPTIGVSAAGGYKMGYPGLVIDTMGLNFTPMAHHKGNKRGTRGHASFNKEIFWQNATDLVEPTLCPPKGPPVNRHDDPENWLFQIYQNLFVEEIFKQSYQFIAIQSPDSGGWLCTYIKKDLLQSLESNGAYEIVYVD